MSKKIAISLVIFCAMIVADTAAMITTAMKQVKHGVKGQKRAYSPWQYKEILDGRVPDPVFVSLSRLGNNESYRGYLLSSFEAEKVELYRELCATSSVDVSKANEELKSEKKYHQKEATG